MPVSLGPQTVVTPISSTTFGPHRREIIGRIEDCTFGIESYLGRFLVLERGEEVFSHPTLFADPSVADVTAGWVRIVQGEDGTLVMRPYSRLTECAPIGNDAFVEATVPALESISVDAVIMLVEAMARFRGCCANPACTGANGRPLDLRRTVLVAPGRGLALCAHCFKKESAKMPGMAKRVIIDGRRLPPSAPVAYLSESVTSS